jgi:DNA-directed RNA polymerase subunit omega
MIYPPITELVKKTGSRYALIIETAKRTRQLVEGAQKLSDVATVKDVTVAVNEIYEDKIEAVKRNGNALAENVEATQEEL